MIRKLLFILTLLLFFSSSLQSQRFSEKGWDIVNLERHQIKFNLFGPGIGYELGLFKNISVSASFGPGLASYQEGYSFGFAWHTRFRYYTNLNRRLDLRKNVSGNSGDYIASARSIFWGPLQISDNLNGPDDFAIAFYGMMYGIQRTYEKGFNFNAELGAGYYRGDGVPNGYGPLFNFTFGWTPKKRKSKKSFKIKTN